MNEQNKNDSTGNNPRAQAKKRLKRETASPLSRPSANQHFSFVINPERLIYSAGRIGAFECGQSRTLVIAHRQSR
jgi:hypothetical protein